MEQLPTNEIENRDKIAVPTGIVNRINTEEFVDIEPSREIMKFKGEFEDLGKDFEELLGIFINYSNECLTAYIYRGELNKLSGIVTQFMNIDVYKNENFTHINELFTCILQFVRSIEILKPDNISGESIGSLKEFKLSMLNIFDSVVDLEFSSKQINTEASKQASKTLNKLCVEINSRVGYIDEKINRMNS